MSSNTLKGKPGFNMKMKQFYTYGTGAAGIYRHIYLRLGDLFFNSPLRKRALLNLKPLFYAYW